MDIRKFSDNITLVGIDYLERESLDFQLVDIVEDHDPDIVGLALCEKRFETMEEKEEWLDKPLIQAYKEGNVGTLIYQTFIEAIRENLRKFKRVEAETHIAELVDLADVLKVDIEFIDRDITLTLKRAFSEMSILEKMKMVWYLKSAMLSFSDDTKIDSVEGMDEHDDLVGGVLTALDRFAPDVSNRMRTERTEYMAKKIYQASKKKEILGVIPESKIDSVMQKLNELKKKEREGPIKGYSHLEKVGKKLYKKALHYTPHVLLVAFAVYLFFFSEALNIWRAWIYWVMVVGGMSALGSALVKGHPISVLISFILAPWMSLTLHGPGWVAGYVEARVRKPKIRDIHDLTSVKSINEFLSNNLVRPVMVGVFANIFTWLGLFIILPLLIALT